MTLKDYTTKELKDELKRRAAAKKEAMSKVERCRNCKHLITNIHTMGFVLNYKCRARTFIMYKTEHNYIVQPSQKACELYERKEQQ